MANHHVSQRRLAASTSSLALALLAGLAASAQAAVPEAATVGLKARNSGQPFDYVNARPLPMPQPNAAIAELARRDFIAALTSPAAIPQAGAEPVSVDGFKGSGKTNPVFLGVPAAAAADSGIAPEAFGTQNHPFSTARADAYTGATNQQYPYRAAGKLFFNKPDGGYICSASLIKRGIVVTAAHCVVDYGKQKVYSDIRFVPGYRNGVAPYGTWNLQFIRVMNGYYSGGDCTAPDNAVCGNDVAVFAVAPQAGAYPGDTTGYLGYATGNYGNTASGTNHLTQLGYPAGLDNGQYMQRNDSQSFVSASNRNNTIIGSLMDGGSSGGPWIVNFGRAPALTGQTAATPTGTNRVVGVTSWGYTNSALKEQGASPFTSSNITTLINAICADAPAACQ